MSLLEDIFLQDEAGEAQELERVIEGYEYEGALSPNSDDSEEREDEAEEDKRRVDSAKEKTKRIIKNPRFLLNPARLTGPRGIQVIPDHFKEFKFKGKGHEKEDLDLVLKKLEHWAYRLYPKFEFADCLKKIETLGKKRPVTVHLRKIRNDQITSDETVVQKDSSDDELPSAPQEEDEFDKLLQQQIELARSTPMSVKKPQIVTSSADRSLMMPKAVSSPSINDEQRERMLRNRRLAEERRLAKLKNANENKSIETVNEESSEVQNDLLVKKHNRTNIIDSSSEDEEMTMNQSILVDMHSKNLDNADNGNSLHSESIEETAEIQNDVLVKDSSSDNAIFNNQAITMHSTNIENNDDRDNNYEIESKRTEMFSVITDEVNGDEGLEKDTKISSLEENKEGQVNAKGVCSQQDKNKASNVDSMECIVGTPQHTENCTSFIENDTVNNKGHLNQSISNEIMDVEFSDDF